MRQQKRDNRILKLEQSKEKSRIVKTDKETISSSFPLDESESEDDNEVDANFVGPKSKSDEKGKTDVMSKISSTADRLNLSIRKRTMIAASTSNALGVSVDDTNISITYSWCHAQKNREYVAASVKADFDQNQFFCLALGS